MTNLTGKSISQMNLLSILERMFVAVIGIALTGLG